MWYADTYADGNANSYTDANCVSNGYTKAFAYAETSSDASAATVTRKQLSAMCTNWRSETESVISL